MVTWGGNALSTFAQEEEIRIEQNFFSAKLLPLILKARNMTTDKHCASSQSLRKCDILHTGTIQHRKTIFLVKEEMTYLNSLIRRELGKGSQEINLSDLILLAKFTQ